MHSSAPSELLERVEASAWAEIQRAAVPEFRDRFGVQVLEHEGSTVLIAPKTDMLALNRVLALGVTTPLRPEVLDELIAMFREAGAARCLMHWRPGAEPIEAPDWFAERGFRAGSPQAKLVRRADRYADATSDLSVIEVDASMSRDFGEIAARGNELEDYMAPGFNSTLGHIGWKHYLALDGGRPVAAAVLFAQGDVAWCGFAGTVVGHRGRGAQSALLARRLRDAAALGCTWVTCETAEDTAERPNPSFRNMRRLGFEIAYLRSNYVLTLT
jgi:hypothetical protein